MQFSPKDRFCAVLSQGPRLCSSLPTETASVQFSPKDRFCAVLSQGPLLCSTLLSQEGRLLCSSLPRMSASLHFSTKKYGFYTVLSQEGRLLYSSIPRRTASIQFYPKKDGFYTVLSQEGRLLYSSVSVYLRHVFLSLPPFHRLVGLVVEVSASRAADPGFESRLRHGDFSWSSHTCDFKTGTPVTTLPGTWRYRVSAGTGRPGISIL